MTIDLSIFAFIVYNTVPICPDNDSDVVDIITKGPVTLRRIAPTYADV